MSPPSIVLATGQRMALDRHGSAGPAVLLLHGIPGWRGTFAEVGRRLAPHGQVLVPDLLGFGASDDPPLGAHAAEHAAAVVGLLDALGVARVHLVGFDFGGPIAVLAARRLADRVRSLTLAATNLFPDNPVPGVLGLARVPVLGPAFFRLAFGRLGLSLMWRGAVSDRQAFPFQRYRAALRFPRGVAWTRRIFLASLRDLPGLYARVEAAARTLKLPSLVLWGNRDPFFPFHVGVRTAAALGAELRLLKGCGHFVPEERPAETAAAILELVKRTEPRGMMPA
jgi:haloalkane dehalogenase